MPKLLENARFDVAPARWFPITVTEVGWKEIASAANRGKPRVALQYAITEEGKWEGKALFDGANLVGGDGSAMARRKLTTLAPDIDWGDFDFPDSFTDSAGIARLVEALKDRKGFALVKHTQRRDDPEAMTEAVARVAREDADVYEYIEDEDDESES